MNDKEVERRQHRVWQLVKMLERDIYNKGMPISNLANALKLVAQSREDCIVLINELRKWLI
jgi:hypothetical protein